jgi:hypothetical protein
MSSDVSTGQCRRTAAPSPAVLTLGAAESAPQAAALTAVRATTA